MQSAAASILGRGVELDKNNKFPEALLLYQEGIQLLINMIKNESGDKAKYLRTKIEEYMNRAEIIKKKVDELKQQGKYHEQIEIKSNSTGYGYEKVFSRFLGSDVTNVLIEDPYIRNFHQFQNLVRFFEVIVKHCTNIKEINLITTKSDKDDDQNNWFNQIKNDLKSYNILFVVEYSTTLHDRKITLSNGWIIKIGRGLDYFKPSDCKLGVGTFDMDFRKCHETAIDIFHSNNVKQL